MIFKIRLGVINRMPFSILNTIVHSLPFHKRADPEAAVFLFFVNPLCAIVESQIEISYEGTL